MKIAIIITNDWELYGDGSGDYFEIQKNPLQQIIEVLKLYNAKITLFAEVLQQLYAEQIYKDNAFAISADWEKTIKNIVALGHDVQLHIHPQLLQSYNKKFSIAELSVNEQLEVLIRGKQYLESVLCDIKKDYECIAFRAGGYAIQPSNKIIPNLLKAGIKCDSTVTKGLFDSYYDFRNAESHFFPWYSNKDICISDDVKDSILEIPIFSVSRIDSPILRRFIPYLYYYLFFSYKLTKQDRQWIKLNKEKKEKYSYMKKYKSILKHSFSKFIFSRFIQNTFQFDYDKIPADILVDLLTKKWQKIENVNIPEYFNECYIPIVFIGHTKNLTNIHNLERILYGLSEKLVNDIKYMTIREYYYYFENKYNLYKKLEIFLQKNEII